MTTQPRTLAHERRVLVVAGLAALLGPAVTSAQGGPIEVEVWKSPTCGCCNDWIKHLEANGFRVRTHDTGNVAMRKRLGIDLRYGSCHTARVAGYAIEGHVPAREIQRLLKEQPRALGLAVQGMPIGSPGMDGPEYEGRRDPYEVLLLQGGTQASVYQAYR